MHFEGTSAVHRTQKRPVEKWNQLGVDYAIAGGMALFFHGYRRFTEDVDVLVTSEDLKRIHDALECLGYVRSFEKSKSLRDAETGVKIVFLVTGQYPGEGKACPIAFPQAAEASEVIEGARVIALPRLIAFKLASGRASYRGGDVNDVQKLIQALGLTRDFALQLEPSVREMYQTKWEDAQRALQEEN